MWHCLRSVLPISRSNHLKSLPLGNGLYQSTITPWRVTSAISVASYPHWMCAGLIRQFSTKLFLANLPFDTSTVQLKDYMESKGGTVVNTILFRNDDGENKGIGLVEYQTKEDAAVALDAFNGAPFMGRSLFMRYEQLVKDRRTGSTDATLIIENLPIDTKWNTLKDIVRERVQGLRAVEVYDEDSDAKSRYAVVRFRHRGEAQAALKILDGANLKFNKNNNNRVEISARYATDYDIDGRGIEDKSTEWSSPKDNNNEWSDRCSAYVTNLSTTVKWQDLKDHMRAAGTVRSANVYFDEKGRLYGVTLYHTPESVQNAIKMLNGSIMKGMALEVFDANSFALRVPSSNRANSFIEPTTDPCKVYVYNLTPDTSWQTLKDHMRNAGDVRSANVFTEDSEYVGVVSYRTPAEASMAVQDLNLSVLEGNEIVVSSTMMHEETDGMINVEDLHKGERYRN